MAGKTLTRIALTAAFAVLVLSAGAATAGSDVISGVEPVCKPQIQPMEQLPQPQADNALTLQDNYGISAAARRMQADDAGKEGRICPLLQPECPEGIYKLTGMRSSNEDLRICPLLQPEAPDNPNRFPSCHVTDWELPEGI